MGLTLRRHGAALAAVALLLLAALPVLTYPLGRDQGEFAVMGRGLLQGRVPYTELWNPKPPAVFYLYAGAMAAFGQTAPALRLLDLLALPLIVLGLYALALKLADRPVGVWSILLFGAAYFTETFWTLTQNDGLALVPMTLAAWAMWESAAAPRRRPLWALACGLLLGWALWFKYPFALFGLALVGGYILLRRAQRARLEGTAIGAFVTGGLITGGGGLIVLAAQGALPALIESIRVTTPYTALGLQPGEIAGWLVPALGYRWQHWGLLIVLAGLAGVLAVRRGRRPPPVDALTRAGWGFIGLWLLSGLGIMGIQAKGYDYHWLPALPPLVLIAAAGLEALRRRWLMRLPYRGAPLIAAVLLLIPLARLWPGALPYLTGREDAVTYAGRFVGGEFNAADSLRVSAYLSERTQRGDSLYIWGFRPEIYFLTGLNPPTRWFFQFPLVGSWYPGEWRQDNVNILWAAMPPYTLVVQGDYLPWVTGSEDDSATLLQSYVELNNWLMANYELERQLGTFQMWSRLPQ